MNFKPEINLAEDDNNQNLSFKSAENPKKEDLDIGEINLIYRGQKNMFESGKNAHRYDVLYKTFIRAVRRYLWMLFEKKSSILHRFEIKHLNFIENMLLSFMINTSNNIQAIKLLKKVVRVIYILFLDFSKVISTRFQTKTTHRRSYQSYFIQYVVVFQGFSIKNSFSAIMFQICSRSTSSQDL